MIYVSTGGEKSTPITETVQKYHQAGINQIELSGGPYLPGGVNELQSTIAACDGLRVSVHNYFPVPSVPFVFNLGSLNSALFEQSFIHAQTAIEWAQKLGSRFYSFHAGFLIDPQVSELGKKIGKRNLFDREKSLECFISAVKKLSVFAKERGVSLFVENNVLSKRNLEEFSANPLLCVTPEETLACMQELEGHAKLLVDVAHLKVSAQSLGFNPRQFLDDLEPFIDAYHLSDNDGTADTNDLFTRQSWFTNLLKRDVRFCTIEVYKRSPQELAKLVELVKGF